MTTDTTATNSVDADVIDVVEHEPSTNINATVLDLRMVPPPVPVRRWDQTPTEPDREADRMSAAFRAHPAPEDGQPSEAVESTLTWEFNTDLDESGLVVDPATPVPDQVMAAGIKANRKRLSFAASKPEQPPGQFRKATYWAVALSGVAQVTIGAAIWTGNADPDVSFKVLVALVVCSLVLIAAEQLHDRRLLMPNNNQPTDHHNDREEQS